MRGSISTQDPCVLDLIVRTLSFFFSNGSSASNASHSSEPYDGPPTSPGHHPHHPHHHHHSGPLRSSPSSSSDHGLGSPPLNPALFTVTNTPSIWHLAPLDLGEADQGEFEQLRSRFTDDPPVPHSFFPSLCRGGLSVNDVTQSLLPLAI